MALINLLEWGWAAFAPAWKAEDRGALLPARVVEERRGAYRVLGERGEFWAEVPGRFRHEVKDRTEYPAVGDWVAVDFRASDGKGTIRSLLPRRSLLVRKASGDRDEPQVLAANVDTLFIVTSLNNDLNPRRLERYLALAADSGVRPVVILSKADLAADAASNLAAVKALSGAAPVFAVSALTGAGMDALAGHLSAGSTAVLLGSSGVGKSTLINRLLGREAALTTPVRAGDDRGRHTTTFRRIFRLDAGALVIDTPGLRELELWAAEDAVPEVFDDVDALAEGCRFRDCAHQEDAGCVVKAAVAEGRLAPGRYANFLKMRQEAGRQARLREEAGWQSSQAKLKEKNQSADLKKIIQKKRAF